MSKEALEPFIDRLKHQPESIRTALVAAMDSAQLADPSEPIRSAKCVVCEEKIDTRLRAVAFPGRPRPELVPGEMRHHVLAHGFWHPMLEGMMRPGDPALVDAETANAGLPTSVRPDETTPAYDPYADPLGLGDPGTSAPTRDGRRRPDRRPDRRSDPDALELDPRRIAAAVGAPRPVAARRPIPAGAAGRVPSRRVGAPGPPSATPDGRARTAPSPGSTSTSQVPARPSTPPAVRPPDPNVGRREIVRSRMGEEASTSPSAEDEAIAREASEAWGLEPAVARRVVAVARRVGTHPADLVNLIGFESAWDPTVRSRSGNVGLLQFAPRTATSLGTTGAAIVAMPALGQLDLVERFLDGVRGGRPLSTPHQLHMAVFYPKAMPWPGDHPFPEEVVRNNTYRKADGSQGAIRTPDDYRALVESGARLRPSWVTPPPETGTGSFLDEVWSFFRGVFETGPSAPQRRTDPVPDDGRRATWTESPGVRAKLVDGAGREWAPGAVPSGDYQLQVEGKPPSPVRIEAGYGYRASATGRMFVVVDAESGG